MPIACRKRRIKCDEFRPICNNCIKSKRVCEGYAQRVVFKNPTGILVYGSGHSVHPQNQLHMRVPIFNDYNSQFVTQQAAAGSRCPAPVPRRVDMAQMGYHPHSSSEVESHRFYYPEQEPFLHPNNGHSRPDMGTGDPHQSINWSPHDDGGAYPISRAHASGVSGEKDPRTSSMSRVGGFAIALVS